MCVSCLDAHQVGGVGVVRLPFQGPPSHLDLGSFRGACFNPFFPKSPNSLHCRVSVCVSHMCTVLIHVQFLCGYVTRVHAWSGWPEVNHLSPAWTLSSHCLTQPFLVPDVHCNSMRPVLGGH